MGVPYFFSVLFGDEGRFRAALVERLPLDISSLSIDMNAIVHWAMSIIYGYGDYEDPERANFAKGADPLRLEQEVFIITHKIVEQIVRSVRPRDVLVLAFDGTCPLAKMQQQKRRRYWSALQRAGDAAHDSNAISPGTALMERLDTFLNPKPVQGQLTRLQKLALDNGIGKIIYSSHLVPGEGEHKIYDYFRRGLIPVGEGKNHVVYGMDADLIMISLLSQVPNLYMARDSIRVIIMDASGTEIRKAPQKKDPNRPRRPPGQQGQRGKRYSNIDFNILRRDIIATYGGRESGVSDFAFSVALMGNDFLPHPAALADMGQGLGAVIEIGSRLERPMTTGSGTGGYSIDSTAVADFLRQLAAREEQLLRDISGQKMKYPSRMMGAATNATTPGTFDLVTFRNAWYSNAIGPRNTRLAASFGITRRPEPNRVAELAMQFLRGLHWTMKYYTSPASEVTWLWYYPAFHAPMLYDLADIAWQLGTTPQNFNNWVDLGVEGKFRPPEIDPDVEDPYEKSDITGYLQDYTPLERVTDVRPLPGEYRFTVLHQLVAIMPHLSLRIVPDVLYPLYRSDSPLVDLQPTGFQVERDGYDTDWQGIPIVPPVDYLRTMEALATLPLDKAAYRKRWKHHIDVTISVTNEDREVLTGIPRRAPRGRAPPPGYRGEAQWEDQSRGRQFGPTPGQGRSQPLPAPGGPLPAVSLPSGLLPVTPLGTGTIRVLAQLPGSPATPGQGRGSGGYQTGRSQQRRGGGRRRGGGVR